MKITPAVGGKLAQAKNNFSILGSNPAALQSSGSSLVT